MSWSAPGGTSVGYSFSSVVDLKQGEVTGYSLGASIPYRFSIAGTVSQPFETGLVGRVYDVWSMTQFRNQYQGYVDLNCLGGTGAPCPSFPRVDNYQGGTLSLGEFIAEQNRFNVNAPDSYSPPSGSLAGQLSVRSTFDNANRPGLPTALSPVVGSLTSFSQNTQATITYSLAQRPWTTTEVLANRVNPVIRTNADGISGISVDITPRFGFSLQEAAALSGYDHFNWLQEILEVRTGLFGPPDARKTYSQAAGNTEELIGFLARSVGYDPGIGCYWDRRDPDCANPVYQTDLSPLYWDETTAPRDLIPGQLDYRWQQFDLGAGFIDVPNLLVRGTQVDFKTQLVGVRSDGQFDILSNLNIPNFDDFTFNWRFTQTADFLSDTVPGQTVIGMLQNIDTLLGGVGFIELLSAAPADPGGSGGVPGNGGGVPGAGTVPAPTTAWLVALISLGLVGRRPAAQAFS